MDEIRTDRRRLRAVEDPAALAHARACASRYLDARIELARALAVVDRQGSHHHEGCGSIRELGTRLGLPGNEVKPLVDLGLALDVPAVPPEPERGPEPCSDARPEAPADPAAPAPTVEDRIRDGSIPLDSAIQLGRAKREGLVSDDEATELAGRAEKTTPTDMRREVTKRREATLTPEPLVRLELFVPESGRDDFQTARRWASRNARFWLSEGQTLAVLSRFYLRAEMLRRAALGSRSPEDVAAERKRRRGLDRKRNRHFPAEEERAIRERSGWGCEILGGCPNVFTEICHVHGTYEGGAPNDREHGVEGCDPHHILLDAGVIRFVGFGEDGRPRFCDRQGRLLTGHDPPRVPRLSEDPPEGLVDDSAEAEPVEEEDSPPPPRADEPARGDQEPLADRKGAPRAPPGVYEVDSSDERGAGEVRERPPAWRRARRAG